MNDNRFHEKAWEEYNLFRMACPHFDELENTIGNTIKETFKDKILDKIKILEIGCGPGYSTSIILDADNRTKITAVDNEHVMIEQAQEILKNFIENKRVDLIEQDALKFLKQQDSDSFDVFASGFTLHNLLKKFRNEVIEEAYRVLKPEGIFINADKYALDDEWKHNETLKWQLQKFEKKYSKINRPDLINEWKTHYLEDNKIEVIMKEWESMKSMKEMGFRNIEIIFRKQMDAVLTAKK